MPEYQQLEPDLPNSVSRNATLARVTELVSKWTSDLFTYPVGSNQQANAAAIAVRLCRDELVQALAGTVGSAALPPDCPNHEEIAHRDRKPPWCESCGWSRAKVQPARKHSEPRRRELDWWVRSPGTVTMTPALACRDCSGNVYEVHTDEDVMLLACRGCRRTARVPTGYLGWVEIDGQTVVSAKDPQRWHRTDGRPKVVLDPDAKAQNEHKRGCPQLQGITWPCRCEDPDAGTVDGVVGDASCTVCGRDNRNATHDAMERRLGHPYTPPKAEPVLPDLGPQDGGRDTQFGRTNLPLGNTD